jgi:hypothetical protein
VIPSEMIQRTASVSGSSVRVGIASPKQRLRLRWTQELHKLFGEAVKELGGAESENLQLLFAALASQV